MGDLEVGGEPELEPGFDLGLMEVSLLSFLGENVQKHSTGSMICKELEVFVLKGREISVVIIILCLI